MGICLPVYAPYRKKSQPGLSMRILATNQFALWNRCRYTLYALTSHSRERPSSGEKHYAGKYLPHRATSAGLVNQGLSGIADLTIPTLGRVNLITGRNDVGKSSILEALRLFAQNAAPQVILDILRNREEDYRAGNESEGLEELEELEGKFPLSSLFYGFPRQPSSCYKVVVSSSREGFTEKLSIYVNWVPVENFASRGQVSQRRGQQSSTGDFDEILSLVVETTGEEPNFYRLEDFIKPLPISRLLRNRRTRIPHQFVSPHGSGRTAHLGLLWDEVIYQGVEHYVLEALHIIEPRISALFMVGDEDSRRSRKAIVRADNLKAPVPLRSFGDG